jgi:hypothetical protein
MLHQAAADAHAREVLDRLREQVQDAIRVLNEKPGPLWPTALSRRVAYANVLATLDDMEGQK